MRGLRDSHELSQGIEDDLEFFSVVGETLFEVGDFSGEGLDGESHAAEFDEGAHEGEAHGDGLGAIENGGRHDGAVFGKNIGEVFTVLTPF